MEEKRQRQTFGRLRRLLRTREFDRVFKAHRSAADAWLVVYAAPNDLDTSRLGLSVGKKAGGSVERNRIKRLLREAFRTASGHLPNGFDFVVVARKNSHNADFGGIKSSLVNLGCEACRRWETR